MSSQDKAGPQDGTEDAATEGRAPDTAPQLPETPQDAETEDRTDIEDAEFVSDADPSDDDFEPADGTDAASDVAEAGHTDDDATVDMEMAEGADDTAEDSVDGASETASDETCAEGQDDATGRDGLGAAALAGSVAGAALGSGGGDAASTPEPVRSAAPAKAQKSGGGFIPAVLGGVIAAGLGAGGMVYFGGMMGDDGQLERTLATQADRLAALDAKLTELSDAIAVPEDDGAIEALGDRLTEQLGGVADRIGTLAGTVDEVQGGLATLDTRLADVTDRLTSVEQRPLTESSEAAQAAFSAYENDLAELRAALDAQTQANEDLTAQLEERAAAAQAEVDAAAARAAELQAKAEEQARIATEQAEARARAAALREAMVGLDAALEKGTPFENYLSVLSEGVEVPQALSDAAAGGVATMPDLRAQFPDLARDALDASIRETVDDDLTERAVAFLKAQTGLRSLAPREGDDPDAVLSRAEAALREYDLGAAVSELSQLPPAGQAVMADWIARAEERRAVTEAAETLAATLLAN